MESLFSKVKTLLFEKKYHAFSGLVALLMLAFAFYTAWDAGQQKDLVLRNELAAQARNIAASISPDTVNSLSFTAEDAERLNFRILCNQLRAYAEATGLRSIYTMALRNNQLVFGPESLRPDDPLASPPGTIFKQPIKKDFLIFETGQTSIDGPATDEYGTFITALAPVKEHRTGKVLMVVGIDLDVSAWQKEIYKAEYEIFLLAILPLITFCTGWGVISWRYRLLAERHHYFRHAKATTCAVTLLLLTLTVAIMQHNAERISRDKEFAEQAQLKTEIYRDTFEHITKNIDILADFFKSSDDVRRTEFSLFANTLMLNSPVMACAWLPEVPVSASVLFEKKSKVQICPIFPYII